MVRNHQDNSGDEEYSGVERRHNPGRNGYTGADRRHFDENRSHDDDDDAEPVTSWNLTPQSITALVSIFGMLGATFWTLSDFRITLANIDQRLNIQAQRMIEYEKRLDDLDKNGTRGSTTTDFTVKSLQKQIDELKDKAQDMDRALMQHNESMMELYKKDISDGKRDFKIPHSN